MKSRFSNEQIVAILNHAKSGTPVKTLCAEHRISKATFYTWRKKRQEVSAPAVAPPADAAKAVQQATA